MAIAIANSSRCDELSSVNYTAFALSIFIVIGILVSYFPQHMRIIIRRSSAGLSPYFILLGTTSGTCAIANIIVLPSSREDMHCCRHISGLACASGLLGIAQVTVQWSCFFLIMLLFLAFFPRNQIPDRDDGEASLTESKPALPSFRDALIVVGVSILHLIFTIILSVALFATSGEKYMQRWADILGIAALVLASIQYLPQIWTTWRLKDVMSLSIPMMCIQTPGAFLFALSLYLRVGWKGWSAWTVYIFTGLMQGCLLAMGIVFMLRRRNAERISESEDVSNTDESGPTAPTRANNETTPLLSGKRSGCAAERS